MTTVLQFAVFSDKLLHLEGTIDVASTSEFSKIVRAISNATDDSRCDCIEEQILNWFSHVAGLEINVKKEAETNP